MVKRLLDFLNASPVNFLAAKNIASYLERAGYRRLDPQMPIGEVKAGDKLYVTKNDSSVYAFHIGSKPLADTGFRMICREAGVPCQRFVNHSDVAGGSTLGNILASSIPVKGVDMGNAILAMHSCRETGSTADHIYCVKAFTKFFS